MVSLKRDTPLTIIHFNDVYDIEPDNNKGGAASFHNALKLFSKKDPLILFSGDVFSPSHLSTIHHGQQMIFPMNKMKIDASCFGNHDFDYTLEHVTKLKNQTNFPWIMSNVYNNETKKPLGDGLPYLIIEKNGLKIGIMGLAESEWLGLLTYPDEIMDYRDYIIVAKEFCKKFKEENCDLIIALTHMRTVNDKKLAENVQEINLILGGHDHVVHTEQVNNTLIMKSGTNFNEFHCFDLDFTKEKSIETNQNLFKFEKYNIINQLIKVDLETHGENIELKNYTEECFKKTEKEMEKIEAFTDIKLDTRFSVIRSQETGIANFFSDLCRIRYDADIFILNMGFLRSDCIVEAGPITYKMMQKMVPVLDSICLLEATGDIILQALENGVSKYPGFDGRFPGVSGIKFAFDPKKESMNRIDRNSIVMDHGVFNEKNTYKLSVKGFLVIGKDGYDVLKNCKKIIGLHNGLTFLNIVDEFFNIFSRNLDEIKKHESKAEKYLLNWEKNLIHRTIEADGKKYVVIKPDIENRITIL